MAQCKLISNMKTALFLYLVLRARNGGRVSDSPYGVLRDHAEIDLHKIWCLCLRHHQNQPYYDLLHGCLQHRDSTACN
jgi:hypothetical protein